MAVRSCGRTARPPKRAAYCNWLKELDRTIKDLPAGWSDWGNHPKVDFQRCRLFIMARFPELPRPFSDQVISNELSRGEKHIRNSAHVERIMGDLKPGQRSQLAGLLLDVIQALKEFVRLGSNSKWASKLAAEHNRRQRMLCRKVSNVCGELDLLQKYAERLHPLLGLEYVHAAKHCLKFLANLKENPRDGNFYSSLKSEYPPPEDPRQLGMVELYWFFRYECQCSGLESEVRVAMLANDFLDSPLKYVPKYYAAESQGCPAVRNAVRRYRPRTAN